MEYRYGSHTVFQIEYDFKYGWSITLSRSLTMVSRWSLNKTRRSGDAYPDLQSATPTHRL